MIVDWPEWCTRLARHAGPAVAVLALAALGCGDRTVAGTGDPVGVVVVRRPDGLVQTASVRPVLAGTGDSVRVRVSAVNTGTAPVMVWESTCANFSTVDPDDLLGYQILCLVADRLIPLSPGDSVSDEDVYTVKPRVALRVSTISVRLPQEAPLFVDLRVTLHP
jgi:hypothetical protein